MKKILFDLECSQSDKSIKFHGGGEYTKTVFEHLVNNYGNACTIAVFYNPDEFCEQWVLDLIQRQSIRLIEIRAIKDLEKIMAEEHFDVLYCGLITKYTGLQLPSDTLKICTLHGLRSIEMKEDSYSYYYYAHSTVAKAKWLVRALFHDFWIQREKRVYLNRVVGFDKMVCVSKHTYYSIMNYLPEISDRVCGVFYTPYKHTASALAAIDDLPEKFILMVSGNRAEKNGARAIKALDEMYSDRLLDYKTVMTGNVPNVVRKKIKNKEKFILLDYVSIDELETLYSKCSVFLYPTLQEGFGMPPEEAMRYGKTCIVSGVCSLPEIYGDIVYYVNPYDIGEIKNRITWAIREPIDEKRIAGKIENLMRKQKNDLDSLCKIIVGIS